MKQRSAVRRPDVIQCLAVAMLSLSGCATTQTARLHTADELNAVARSCGLALGELFQDASEKRLLFLFRPGPSAAERSCVAGWARQNGLRAVFVNAIQYQGS